MNTNELTELGIIKDIDGNKWTIYASGVNYKGMDELELAGIVIESKDGKTVHHCDSLASMPTRFSQVAINNFESDLLENNQASYNEYLKELQNDIKREDMK